MTLSFTTRSNGDKVESREVAKRLKTNHSKWLHRVLLANLELIEKETAEVLEIESITSTKGKPVKVAWLTATQLLFAISLSSNTEESMELKSEISREMAYLLHKRKTVRNEPMKSLQWENRLEKIFAYKESPFATFEKIDQHFSPDKHFAQFLLQLETLTGYSTPWNVEEKIPFVCPHGYEKYVKKYSEITSDAHENNNGWILDMWGVNELPMLDYDYELPSPDEVQSYGLVWVDEPENCQELWIAFMEQVKALIEVYEDPERKEKYGIPSTEEVAGGYDAGYVDWKINSEPLEAILEAKQAFDDVYYVDVKITGFQVHKDWLDWLKSDEEIARAMRKFYVGSNDALEFKIWTETDEDDYKLLYLTQGTLITRHRSWLEPIDFDNLDEEAENVKRPFCEDARLYDKKYLPLFDWYLNNIWLPQHSVKFFQTIDPEGFPKLCEAMKALPPNSALPHTFIQAMQPQLTGI